jgi:hypothetical protein
MDARRCVLLSAALSGLVGASLGFGIGCVYQGWQWRVASPALRQSWRAKEGSLERRIREAERAIQLDRRCLIAHVWKARAWLEGSEAPEAPTRALSILTEGLRSSEADHALAVLERAYRQLGREEDADAVHGLLATVFGRPWVDGTESAAGTPERQ